MLLLLATKPSTPHIPPRDLLSTMASTITIQSIRKADIDHIMQSITDPVRGRGHARFFQAMMLISVNPCVDGIEVYLGNAATWKPIQAQFRHIFVSTLHRNFTTNATANNDSIAVDYDAYQAAAKDWLYQCIASDGY